MLRTKSENWEGVEKGIQRRGCGVGFGRRPTMV